jgi:hypothetical protein
MNRTTVLYLNNASTASYGSYNWANTSLAIDGIASTASTVSIPVYTVAYSSYYLYQNFSSRLRPVYSGDTFFKDTIKISKVEVGFYTDGIGAGYSAFHLYGYVNYNSGSYISYYTRDFAATATSSPLLTWCDITSMTGAPDRWTNYNLSLLNSRVHVVSDAYSADKSSTYNVSYIFDTYLRVTWTPINILTPHNF